MKKWRIVEEIIKLIADLLVEFLKKPNTWMFMILIIIVLWMAGGCYGKV